MRPEESLRELGFSEQDARVSGRASSAEGLVPFGGEHAYKAFGLAVGLQVFVEALAGAEGGAVLVVARPEADPSRRCAR